MSDEIVVGVVDASPLMKVELGRLLCDWIRTEYCAGTTLADARHLAVLDCGRDIRTSSTQPIIAIRRGFRGFNEPVRPAIAHLDLAQPADRLSLLGMIAKLSQEKQSAGATHSSDKAILSDLFLNVRPLYQLVWRLQTTFDLQLRVGALARRLACSERTLRRLFHDQGRVTPERLLQWIRMGEVAVALRRGATVEEVARQLGFEHAESMRRSMRGLAGLTLSSLRADRSLNDFQRRMMEDFDGTRTIPDGLDR